MPFPFRFPFTFIEHTRTLVANLTGRCAQVICMAVRLGQTVEVNARQYETVRVLAWSTHDLNLKARQLEDIKVTARGEP